MKHFNSDSYFSLFMYEKIFFTRGYAWLWGKHKILYFHSADNIF